ncbi:LacI family DNA-binding transcriptional regulator [Clostridium folliculivorans]|uniref:LacI family transcriptional regulator n=1 Tax=Clostridium folliculivorans TaxID=2886038 RepID=A0A9W6D7Z9_9CLOT|nr:LacI family DNA-binding transcriptional regulator [Clostridium folliculivorans]GKU23415.1 LacI family transcriptional regulator [Clostridium folliculivorans]GKU29532.1 LacI family transcriptional regulator [Clostridium folliculivorans]
MNVTIKDVAREANVSPSTVSRVLAGNPRISDETKEKVMETVKRLNYHPNVIARSLANNVTKILGLILPSGEEDLFRNPFFIQVMTGISIYAQKMGYSIVYTFSKNEEEEIAFLSNYINSKMVDGMLLLTTRTEDKCVEYLNERQFPFVIVGRPEISADILWVDNDNRRAMYDVTKSLIDKGHDDIAFIGGPSERTMSKDRLSGYKDALVEANISIDEKLILQMDDFIETEGYEACSSILEYRKPSAIVTTDDLLAFGVSKKLKEEKIKDVWLVGFNNIPLSEYQNPPLSTVDINAKKLGYYATKLLIDRLQQKEQELDHYIIETKFIERESTK